MKKSLFTALVVGLGLTAKLWAQVPSYVPSNGLVGWWPFNGNANDESGNGNNGTVNGATLTSDRNGLANKAYSFDGTDDILITNSNNLNFSLGITFSSWINATNLKMASVVDKTPVCINTNNYTPGFRLNVRNNGDVNSSSGCYGVGNGAIAQNAYSVNNWKFITGTWSNNGILKIFINGNLINQIQTNNTSINNQEFIEIGKGNLSSLYERFEGKIDDIGIWNRALTECEVQDLYNSQINSVAGSIAVSPNLASIASNVTLLTASSSTNVQWQTNGLNLGWQNVPSNSVYSGGTTNTLTVNNVQLSNHNQSFRVIASNGNCVDTSNIATIQIADTCITNVTIYDTLLTTVTDTLIINTTLSLPAPNNANTIKVYPNPASDHITIYNGNYSAMVGYSIKITNNAGQQVFQSAINQQQFYVDLSTWNGNGLYFVHLIDPQNNTVTVRKIVLQ